MQSGCSAATGRDARGDSRVAWLSVAKEASRLLCRRLRVPPESQAARETFRGSGPDKEQRGAMLTVAVQEYIADVRPVFGKEAE
jgi:hypothetical protein